MGRKLAIMTRVNLARKNGELEKQWQGCRWEIGRGYDAMTIASY